MRGLTRRLRLLRSRLLGGCRSRYLLTLLHLTRRGRLPVRLTRRIRGGRLGPLLLILLGRLSRRRVVFLLLPWRIRVARHGGARERHRKRARGRQAHNRWPHRLSLLVRSSGPEGWGK